MINLIACENLPFQIANSPHFRALINQTGEAIKDESHYRKKLPDVYAAVQKRILEELKNCKSLSLTSDIWTSKTHSFIRYSFFVSYENNILLISLTAEGISENWNIKSYVLAVREFPGTHTGQLIAEKLADLINDWGISSCVRAFVTDSASNYKKAFEEISEDTFERILPYERSSCGAHLLNNAVKGCFGDKDGAIHDLLGTFQFICY